jgi:hypothetical protein
MQAKAAAATAAMKTQVQALRGAELYWWRAAG